MLQPDGRSRRQPGDLAIGDHHPSAQQSNQSTGGTRVAPPCCRGALVLTNRAVQEPAIASQRLPRPQYASPRPLSLSAPESRCGEDSGPISEVGKVAHVFYRALYPRGPRRRVVVGDEESRALSTRFALRVNRAPVTPGPSVGSVTAAGAVDCVAAVGEDSRSPHCLQGTEPLAFSVTRRRC